MAIFPGGAGIRGKLPAGGRIWGRTQILSLSASPSWSLSDPFLLFTTLLHSPSLRHLPPLSPPSASSRALSPLTASTSPSQGHREELETSTSSRALSPSLRQRHNRSSSSPSSSTTGALFPVVVFVFNRGSLVSISTSSKILFFVCRSFFPIQITQKLLSLALCDERKA
ncbi:uncharacterized protein DS421_1g29640 [Arachis hypogaea]|nr:uncharacterized protein DS421_1g29640 [Arachis hypogaea]